MDWGRGEGLLIPQSLSWCLDLSECQTDSDCPDDHFCGEDDQVCVACGGLINATSAGYLSSPYYPNDYPKNLDCEWQIIVPVGERIKIEFTTFDVEKHSACE